MHVLVERADSLLRPWRLQCRAVRHFRVHLSTVEGAPVDYAEGVRALDVEAARLREGGESLTGSLPADAEALFFAMLADRLRRNANALRRRHARCH